jgi:integrase
MNVRGAGHLYRPKYRARDGERREAGVYWWKVGRARMSTGCRTEGDAQKWALERLIEMRRGHLVGVRAAALRWDDIERMLCDRWQADGRQGMLQCMARLRHLRRAFQGWRADAITTDRITAYAVRRRGEGAAVGTVNLELAILRRGFSLAREAGRLDVIPVVHRLPGEVHRTGTVERGDLDAILAALPARYRSPIEALYWTGWRESEILRLVWQRVDLAAHELRLDTSKSGQPRILCFASIPALQGVLEEAHRRRGFGPFVFPGRAQRQMDRTALQKAWRIACRAAGCPGALIHDLRRTAVRDMRRAGVSLAVAMGAVGHQSLTIHQGYSVVAREDQDAGMAQLVALRAGEPVQRRFAVMER